MKKRFGFVSNSSSSSFIINFGTKPETKEELAEKMGDCSPAYHYSNSGISSERVVKSIWNEIKNNLNNSSSIINHLQLNNVDVDCSVSIGEYLFEDISEQIQRSYWDQKHITIEEIRRLVNEKLDKISETDNSDDFITCIDLSDEDGSYWGALEHGNIFRNCKSVERISNH